MQKIILLCVIFVSQVSLAQLGFGIGPNKPVGGFGMSPWGGYGLSPDQAAHYQELLRIQLENHQREFERNKKMSEQMETLDPQLRAQIQAATGEFRWENQNGECKSRLLALVKSTPEKKGIEFILKKDHLVYTDGTKTYNYSNNLLTIVSGRGCEHQRVDISKGMEAIFDSTLPKVDPPKGELNEEDERIHKELFKSHLATLNACKILLSDEYVNRVIKTWHMDNENTSARPRTKSQSPATP